MALIKSELHKNGEITLKCDYCMVDNIINKSSYSHWRQRNKKEFGEYICSNCRILETNKKKKKSKYIEVQCDKCNEFRIIVYKSNWMLRKSCRKCINQSSKKIPKPKLSKSEISRQRSDTMMKLWRNPDYHQKQYDYRNQEWRDKISKSIKKKWGSGDYEHTKINRNTWIQRAFRAALELLDIKYDEECSISEKVPFKFDFKIGNLLIELDGDYWHNSSKEDCNKDKRLRDNQANDKRKNAYVRHHNNYKLIRIKEHELKCFNKILSFIIEQFNVKLNLEPLDYSKLKFNKVPLELVRDFVNSLHYLSKPRYGGIAYEVILNGDRIGVMVLQRPVRQEVATSLGIEFAECYEVTRVVIKPKFHKSNLISWMLSKIIKDQYRNTDTKVIVSFADSTFGHTGACYKAANFKLVSVVPPDYLYQDSNGFLMHKKTMWDHAKQMKMTEEKYAATINYKKIYGGEKLKFAYWLQK